MNIAIDIFGGDYAPQQTVRGILHFLQNHNPTDVVLFFTGDEATIAVLAEEHQIPSQYYRIVHAPEVIRMEDLDTNQVLQKTNSSLFCGLEMLRADRADVFITAGNSMALVSGLKKYDLCINDRPVAAVNIPQPDGRTTLLLDAGLNVDCSATQLNHFASMAADRFDHPPAVALLNIGKEEGKGNQLARAAFELLKKNPLINFIGNIEGNDITQTKAEVILCDGFTGNIVLKLLESFAHFDQQYSFEEYGGAVLMGLKKPVILGHGRSTAKAFEKMLEQAILLNKKAP